jgi:hypothetical protein
LTKVSLPVALALLVLLWWWWNRREEEQGQADGPRYQVIQLPPPPPPGPGNSDPPLQRGCETVMGYNDPARYVGSSNPNVRAVSTANTVLTKVNCGAVGLAEGAWKWAKGLF